MALNDARMTCDEVLLAVPSGYVAGDPIAVGFIVGVLQTSRDTNGNAVVRIKPSSQSNLSVQALTTIGSAGSASAVAQGDKLYVDSSKNVSKDSSGKLIGYAIGTVSSGQTATIAVLLA